jgi:organic hydroperoxide reductase OsmC/OhrA
MEYEAKVEWKRDNTNFLDNRYSRKHTWHFDGGVSVVASSSPQVVPVPMSDETAVDPEEAFVASLSSCHMLWFLAIAGKKRFIVDEYVDDAIGFLAKNSNGKLAMTGVTLRPKVTFSGDKRPTTDEQHAMHHQAHDACFIANSVTTDIKIEPIFI